MSDLADFIDALRHNRAKRGGTGVYASDKVYRLLDEFDRLRQLATQQHVMLNALPADVFASVQRAFSSAQPAMLEPGSNHPPGFVWIDQPVTVTGGDYAYSGQLLLSFPKSVGGAVRYIVRDGNNRLFIHNARQLGLEADGAPHG